MIKRSRWLSFGLGMISGPLLMYSCCAFGPAAGHSKVLQKEVSPDGKYVASVVTWSQGAVGCHRHWVTVDLVADKADPGSNGHVVYAQEDSRGGESVEWKGSNRLVITYLIGGYGFEDPGYVTQSNSNKDGRVAIEYAIVDPAREDPQREDQQHG